MPSSQSINVSRLFAYCDLLGHGHLPRSLRNGGHRPLCIRYRSGGLSHFGNHVRQLIAFKSILSPTLLLPSSLLYCSSCLESCQFHCANERPQGSCFHCPQGSSTVKVPASTVKNKVPISRFHHQEGATVNKAPGCQPLLPAKVTPKIQSKYASTTKICMKPQK